MTGVILAAGRSTRTGRSYPKVLLTLNGRYVLDYVIDTSRQAGAERIVVIVGFQRELVEKAFEDQAVEFAVQPEQRGTADALLGCESLLSADEDIVVLSGDVPLISAKTLRGLMALHQMEHADVTLLTAVVSNPTGYGRIVRQGGRVYDIVEEKDASAGQKAIKEMNVGLYALRWGRVLPLLKKIEPSPKTGEYYLPKLIRLVADRGGKVCSVETNDPSEFMGINTLVEREQVEEELTRRSGQEGMVQGTQVRRERHARLPIGNR